MTMTTTHRILQNPCEHFPRSSSHPLPTDQQDTSKVAVDKLAFRPTFPRQRMLQQWRCRHRRDVEEEDTDVIAVAVAMAVAVVVGVAIAFAVAVAVAIAVVVVMSCLH